MSFVARRLQGAAAVSGAFAALPSGAQGGVFQSEGWLSALNAELAAALGAETLAIEVRASPSGEFALLLPLLATRERGFNIARVASLGVSDYGGPVLGSGAPQDKDGAEALWAAIVAALGGFDLIEIENMPRVIGGRVNPLAIVAGVERARHSRNALAVAGSVEDLLRSLGKKYRKEAERCGRLLAERGRPFFRRAETANDIAAGFAVLEAQQHARRLEAGGTYVLDRPEYSRFYERVLQDGTPRGTAHLFTLGAGEEIGACLLGMTHEGVFTLLRISTAGGEWKRVSPGRLVVLETMRYFIERGVATFDMGIGDYAFKHGFGIEPEALVTLKRALSAKAWPKVAYGRIREAARRNERLAGLVRRFRGA